MESTEKHHPLPENKVWYRLVKVVYMLLIFLVLLISSIILYDIYSYTGFVNIFRAFSLTYILEILFFEIIRSGFYYVVTGKAKPEGTFKYLKNKIALIRLYIGFGSLFTGVLTTSDYGISNAEAVGTALGTAVVPFLINVFIFEYLIKEAEKRGTVKAILPFSLFWITLVFLLFILIN